MIKPSDILGMNARQRLYTALNSKTASSICSSKYATKILLQSKNIPTATVYGILATNEDVNDFEWPQLVKNFVIKPTNGNAGKGVVAFRTIQPDGKHWLDTLGKTWTLDDIKLHCFDILEGQYSTYGSQHNIIIEERVPIHTSLLKYAFKGTPDIRVIVFNHVPVMAMLRLPTPESEGRANVAQGALGVGIDMATGITTYAVAHKQNLIKYLPGSKAKLNGIKIPFWTQTLKIAVEAAEAANLAFAGIDLFVHDEKGPLVVELNANPGLSIQNANQAGLRRRLERVEDLNVRDAEHGVKISQALFAERFADKIKAKEGLTIVSPREEIIVFDDQKKPVAASALINTGRARSAIASDLASELGLIDLDDLLWFQPEQEEGKVPVVEVGFKLKDQKIKTAMLVSKKLNNKKYKLEIGRQDLANFLVGST
jgi:alpha-L-glutamate ligase-like protein